MANATAEVMWVQTLLKELGGKATLLKKPGVKAPTYARLWCDNIGVV